MISIETERLVIRNFKIEDAGALRELIVQKEASAYALYDHEWPTSEAEIRGITAWFASEDHFLAICQKETEKLIGFVGLNQNEGKGSEFDLGYSFNFDYHGKGYATEACRALIDFAFTTLHADRLTSGTAEANAPSVRLLQRLGFRIIQEGVTSFRKTPDGRPVEFKGLGFELKRETWLEQSAGQVAYQG